MIREDIIKENEDCDAEYFLASWLGIDTLPKHRLTMFALEICEIMEEYHRQRNNFMKASPPPVEGAEEILKPMVFSDDLMLYSIGEDISFVSYGDALRAMQEFATLHARRIADKMINQSIDKRINGAVKNEDMLNKMNCLIGYLEQWCKNPQSYPPVELESVINEATEYLESREQ